MKAVAVGILAMMALAGCGVGADEYWDGNQLVSSNGQALEIQPGTVTDPAAPLGPQAPQVGVTPMLAPVVQLGGGTVSLPQDPIPVKGFGPTTVQQIR